MKARACLNYIELILVLWDGYSLGLWVLCLVFQYKLVCFIFIYRKGYVYLYLAFLSVCICLCLSFEHRPDLWRLKRQADVVASISRLEIKNKNGQNMFFATVHAYATILYLVHPALDVIE